VGAAHRLRMYHPRQTRKRGRKLPRFFRLERGRRRCAGLGEAVRPALALDSQSRIGGPWQGGDSDRGVMVNKYNPSVRLRLFGVPYVDNMIERIQRLWLRHNRGLRCPIFGHNVWHLETKNAVFSFCFKVSHSCDTFCEFPPVRRQQIAYLQLNAHPAARWAYSELGLI